MHERDIVPADISTRASCSESRRWRDGDVAHGMFGQIHPRFSASDTHEIWQNPFICNSGVRQDAMDRSLQLIYEKDFRIRYLESRKEAFQNLFETLMSKRFPSDFEPCKPWGRQGDEKNDGYLPSARTLFQVYAPEAFDSAKAVTKINADLNGALPHWQQYFDHWVFVHNAPALPPNVIKTLADLRTANPQIAISHWGYEELLKVFRELEQADLESWFGVSYSGEDRGQMGYADLKAVVEHIKFSSVDADGTPRPVPQGKIEFNQLSPEVAGVIKLAMEKVRLVESFFAGWRDPLFAARIAAAFKARYIELRTAEPAMHPDLIWGELEEWAGYNATRHPREKAAIHAVLAWLFGNCDIFEEPLVVS